MSERLMLLDAVREEWNEKPVEGTRLRCLALN